MIAARWHSSQPLRTIAAMTMRVVVSRVPLFRVFPAVSRASTALALTAMLGACATGASPPERPRYSDAPARTLAGELTLARDRFALAPCVGKVAFAHDNTRDLELATLVRERNAGGDGALFIVAAIAQEPDGTWRIDRVRRAYRDGPRCSEALDEFVWRGQGESGWTLEATSRRVTLRLGDREPLRFPFRPFARDAEGNYVFSGAGDKGAATIVMRPERCVQGDAMYSYAVRITALGQELTGCAWNGERPAG
jgi:uncharacterized membrane protein